MKDLWIILLTAVGFPVFGVCVFFYWRWQYGAWAPHRRKPPQQDVRVVKIDEQSR